MIHCQDRKFQVGDCNGREGCFPGKIVAPAPAVLSRPSSSPGGEIFSAVYVRYR